MMQLTFFLGNPSKASLRKNVLDAGVELGVSNYAAHLSRVMRKPAFCICENKDADQLRSNREADQRLCFRN